MYFTSVTYINDTVSLIDERSIQIYVYIVILRRYEIICKIKCERRRTRNEID